MELNQLKSFIQIAREKNLTRAAEALNLSQSALSTQLKLLEEELGIPLFERTSRGMILTEKGEGLLTHAQEILDAAERMRVKARSLSRSTMETVTIGLNAEPSFLRVAVTNRRLSLLRPDLNVTFFSAQTPQVAALLRQGTIDVGFVFGESLDSDIGHSILTRVRLCVAIPVRLVPAGSQVAWTDLARLPWILSGSDSPFFAALTEKFDRHRVLPRQVVIADPLTAKELLADGQGVSILSEEEAIPLVESGAVTLWEPGWMTLPLSLAWYSKNGQVARIKAAREAILHSWRETRYEPPEGLADKYWV